MNTHAHNALERAGMRSSANRARVIAWWGRYELATGRCPDVLSHLRILRRGLRWPLEHHPDLGFTLRTCGEARR